VIHGGLVPEVVDITDFTVASADESRDLVACLISGVGTNILNKYNLYYRHAATAPY